MAQDSSKWGRVRTGRARGAPDLGCAVSYDCRTTLLTCRHSALPDSLHGHMNSSLDRTLERGAALHGGGDPAAAAVLYEEILRHHPAHADALHLLGVAHTQLGRPQRGVELIGRSLALNAAQPVAAANLGNAWLALNRPDEALAAYDRSLALWPGYGLAAFGRGNALTALGRSAEALQCFDDAVRATPRFAEALHARGNLLLKLDRLPEAVASFDAVLELAPALASAHAGRGHALSGLGRMEAAIAAYDRAVECDPALADAWLSRGIALAMQGRHGEAAVSFTRVLEIDPNHPYAAGARLHARLQECDWTQFDASRQAVVDAMEQHGQADFPFSFLAVCDSPTLQLACARQFSRHFRATPPPLWAGERYDHDRIRIAYISADFLEHPTSYLLAGLFEKHDRRRFEITGVCLQHDVGSPTGRRVRSAFERLIDADALTDAALVQLLRELEIDIAVDLMGYTGEHRTNILAYRPAPIQVNYLGFPATMGTADVDYLIADEFLIPPETRAAYSERVVLLPDCFQANDDRRPGAGDLPTRHDVGLPESALVWCSFHSSYKLNPALFDVWARLLRQVPGSVLWILANHASVERNLRTAAQARGVDPGRLVFARSVPYPQHLARLPLADMCLDTLPFNGGATTSDALWAGVPVLTCAGQSFAARMSGSLLRAVGMSELITHSLEDYERVALQLAAPGRLRELRTRLAERRATAALFDTDRFRRHLEAAFIAMVETPRLGDPRAPAPR